MAKKKSSTKKKKLGKGSVLTCSECGLTVKVDEPCCCTETHEIWCCSQPMNAKDVKINESGNA